MDDYNLMMNHNKPRWEWNTYMSSQLMLLWIWDGRGAAPDTSEDGRESFVGSERVRRFASSIHPVKSFKQVAAEPDTEANQASGWDW